MLDNELKVELRARVEAGACLICAVSKKEIVDPTPVLHSEFGIVTICKVHQVSSQTPPGETVKFKKPLGE